MSFVTTAELNTINANWKYRTTIERGNYQFLRYSNNEVPGLWKITMSQMSPPAFAGFIMTTQACASSFAYEQKWTWEKNRNVDSDGIHDNAWPLIQTWKDSLKPEPEPEPEEKEEENPVDEGNGIIDGWLDGIKGWIQQAILAGLAFLEEPLKIIKELVAKLGQTIAGIVSGIESAISTVMAKMASIFDTIVGKIQGVIDVVWQNIEKIWLTLKDMFNSVKTAIVKAFEKSWIFIKETLTSLWEKMKRGLTYIGDQIVAGLKYLWDKVKDALNWAWKILNNAYNAIVDTVSAVWDRFKEKLTDTIESIKAAFGDAIDRLTDFFTWYIDAQIKDWKSNVEWTEDRLVEVIKFMVRAQRKVLNELSKEGIR